MEDGGIQIEPLLELGPVADASLWCGRGVALKALGHSADAEKAYQKALAFDAGYRGEPEFLFWIALVSE